MIRKRLLSACLALALCLGLLPVTALAEGTAPQTLYVGSTTISAGYWTSSDGGTTWARQKNQPEGNNYIYYDGQGTLELHNVTIQRGSNTVSAPYGAGIYALSSSGQPVALTIELIGTNTITGTFGIFLNAEIDASSYGTNATLTITSENNGSLQVSGLNYGIYVKSGTGGASLNINDASVVASSSSSYSGYAGVYVQSGASATNSPNISLSVDGGSLTASASEGNDGIQFYVGSSEATGATTSLTVSDNAIVDAKTGGIKASDPNPNDLSDQIVVGPGTGTSGGIVFDGTEGTVYGEVTLEENLTIGEGETLTIGKDASLTVPDGKTLTNKGTVTNSGTLTNNGTINNSGTLPSNIGGTAPPSITTTSPLVSGTVGTEYSVTLAASGTETITWSNSGNLPAGLTLDENTGLISGTPTTQETYYFTVTATNSGGSDSKEFTLSIDEQGTIHVTDVSLNTDSLSLYVGGTDTLTATITPDTATNKTVTWTSSNPNVATVDNGVVSAVGSGTAIITVTTEDGNYTAVCTVSVTPYIPPVPSYLIQLPEVEGGTVTADRAAARQGTEVTLTVTPDEGFALASLAVTDFFGNTVDITRNSDGAYSFTMPYSQVEVSAAFTPLALPFADVDEGDWFHDEVAYVWAHGLMDGVADDRFHPEGTASRAMVWAILARMDGETVTGEGWAEAARAWAMETGVSDGEDGGAPVTREQLAAMLYRYAARKGWDVTERADLSAFADGDDVSDWALDALAWASAAGIVEGTAPATLEPQGEAVRAQLAAMLARFCQTAAP